MATLTAYHTPVLLHESVDALITDEGGIYADATFGGGGHSAAILDRLGKTGRLLAFDQDEDAIRNNSITDPRLTLIRSNFRFILNFALLKVPLSVRLGFITMSGYMMCLIGSAPR